MAGGAFFLSDDLRALEMERMTWGLEPAVVAQGRSGLTMIPEDPFPAAPPDTLVTAFADLFAGTSTHVLPAVWRLPNGEGRVLLNIQDSPQQIEGTRVPARSALPVSP